MSLGISQILVKVAILIAEGNEKHSPQIIRNKKTLSKVGWVCQKITDHRNNESAAASSIKLKNKKESKKDTL